MGIDQDAYASYKLLAAEFERRGYVVSTYLANDRTIVRYTSPAGKVWETPAAHIRYPFNTAEAVRIIVNKEKSGEFVQGYGVRVPETYYVGAGETPAKEVVDTMLRRYDSLVVKPSNASLSKGLTLDVTSCDAVVRAVEYARSVSEAVVVQEQARGEEVRFVALGGTVVAALLRQTSRVVGDGSTTIAELIKKENKIRETLRFAYVSYPQLDETNVDPSILMSSTVPKSGEVVELNRATMIKHGCSVYNVLEDVHPSYVKMAEQTVGELTEGFVVMDIILQDYTAPMGQNYWFIEFNSAPVLKLFYGCRDGRNYDIVPQLCETIDRWLHAS